MEKESYEIRKNVYNEFDLGKESSEVRKIYYFFKRCLDIIASFLGLIIIAPIFFIISIFYLFGDNKGTVFYRQKRCGKDKRNFYIYKFRTMIKNADEKLKQDNGLYQKYIDNGYKLSPDEDPRITKFGRFLRETSLDELPQLLNVLKGEMSLVGPRPVVEEEVIEYKERAKEFLSVKPGLTGYWQVSGRSDVNYPERVDLELYYVYNQSFWFDIKILFLTVYVVVLKKGAY